MTKTDLKTIISSLEAVGKLENVEVLRIQRDRYCAITQALTKRIDKITKQIERLTSQNKDLLAVTDAIVNQTPATKTEPTLVPFSQTGLATNKNLKVVLTWVRKTGGRYQFVFQDPTTGKQFQLNRPVGPWTTPASLSVIRYTVNHITGKKGVGNNHLQAEMEALCNKPLQAKVVIMVQPVSGALNWQTRASW
jgi:hypothetical protein